MKLGIKDLSMLTFTELANEREKIEKRMSANITFRLDRKDVSGQVVIDAIDKQMAYMDERQTRTKGWEYQWLDQQEILAHSIPNPASPMPYKMQPRIKQKESFIQRTKWLVSELTDLLKIALKAKRESKIKKFRIVK